MSNALYAKGKEKLLSAALNLPADTIKVAMVSSAYTPDLNAHEFFSDISASVLGTPQALGTKTITGGVFDAADTTFATVAAGATVKAVVIYKDTGAAGTSALLAYIDTVTGFPLATNGGDITIAWDNGASRIFAL